MAFLTMKRTIISSTACFLCAQYAINTKCPEWNEQNPPKKKKVSKWRSFNLSLSFPFGIKAGETSPEMIKICQCITNLIYQWYL